MTLIPRVLFWKDCGRKGNGHFLTTLSTRLYVECLTHAPPINDEIQGSGLKPHLCPTLICLLGTICALRWRLYICWLPASSRSYPWVTLCTRVQKGVFHLPILSEMCGYPPYPRGHWHRAVSLFPLTVCFCLHWKYSHFHFQNRT